MQLIDRIEAAKNGSRELDAEIDALLGWRRFDNPFAAGGLVDMWHGPNGFCGRRDERLHAYSTSLDAAMSLVPDGFHVALGSPGMNADKPDHWAAMVCETKDEESAVTFAKSGPLSICAAALKARQ